MLGSPKLGAVAALAATLAAWSVVPLILRYFATDTTLDAWTVNGLRYLFTVLFWLPLVVVKWKEIPPGRQVWRDAAIPAACHTVGQIGWGLAPYYNDASVMNFVSRISFLFTVLAGFWLLRDERRMAKRPLFWWGVMGTAAGVLAMFGGGQLIGNTSPAGIGILLWTAACWALYAVNVRRSMQGYSTRLAFGVVSILVAPTLTLLMFLLGDWRQMFSMSLELWTLLAVSAWVAIALGHVLYYQAVRTLGPIVSEGSLALIPFTTAICAHLVLGERMLASQWIGGSILVGASLCLLAVKVGPRTKSAVVDEPAGG